MKEEKLQKFIEKKTRNKIGDRGNLKEKCRYFPCHNIAKEEFDCRTCYCPFYEICSKEQNTKFGGYLLKEEVWACEKCLFIHRKEIVEEIVRLENRRSVL